MIVLLAILLATAGVNAQVVQRFEKVEVTSNSASALNVTGSILASHVTAGFTGALVGNVTGDLTGNVTGNVTGNLTGNVVGNVTGEVTGNALTATTLSGSLPSTQVTFTDVTTGDATASQHGFLPKLSGSASQFLSGTGTFSTPSVSVSDANITFTDITTGNATSSQHGFMPKLSGNAYDWATGSGIYTRTLARGTITSSSPWTYTQTWNQSGVQFTGVSIDVTQNAGAWANTSRLFEVSGGTAANSGALCVGLCNGLTYALIVPTVIDNSPIVAANELRVNNQITLGDARYLQTPTRGWLHWSAIGMPSFGGPNSADEYAINTATIPVLTSGWGGSASISGLNSVGRVTIGTAPGTDVVLTFGTAFTTNAPHCDGVNETTAAVIPVKTVTTAAVTFTGTFNASDKFSYHCIGWHAQ